MLIRHMLLICDMLHTVHMYTNTCIIQPTCSQMLPKLCKVSCCPGRMLQVSQSQRVFMSAVSVYISTVSVRLPLAPDKNVSQSNSWHCQA